MARSSSPWRSQSTRVSCRLEPPTRVLVALAFLACISSGLLLARFLHEMALAPPPSIRPSPWRVGTITAHMQSSFDTSDSGAQYLSGLDVVSRAYVISLPQRADRREDMEHLRNILHLRWTYLDAADAASPAVAAIMRQVHVLRAQLASLGPAPDVAVAGPPSTLAEKAVENVHIDGTSPLALPTFHWPDDIDRLVHSQEAMLPLGADVWPLPYTRAESDGSVSAETADPFWFAPLRAKASFPHPLPPLACASGDQLLAPFSQDLPPYKRLTPAKVACWHSHLQAIRQIANGGDSAALVLEDDVDMERDISARLRALWDALPDSWDIVYLGHCWSNESALPALRVISSHALAPLDSDTSTSIPARNLTALHPSVSPKCTHAYALSRAGARRVLAHLRHPPFAYSRAIDQALAWLVQSGRLQAFSVVPPLVVQRKVAGSDVMPGRGSAWREGLFDGVFGSRVDRKEHDIEGDRVAEREGA